MGTGPVKPGPKTGTLKIGLVLDDGLDKPDGVQQYILALGGWLQSQGHEVRYLVGQTARGDIAGVHSLSRNVRVRFNGNRMSIPLPTGRRKLRRFLRAERFDVLHVQVPYSPFMAQRLILAADADTAVVGTFHIAPNDWMVTHGNRLLGLWLRRSLKRFDTMLSVSPAAAAFAKATFGVDSRVLPNVIDYRRFHDAQPFKQYRDGRLNVLFLGRLVPRKGSLQLLKAVAELAGRSDMPDFRVFLCGGGPLEPKLRQFVAANGLSEVVQFEGFVAEDDKPRYYATADIAVFPATGGESFGIVLLEAMAGGKAAILAGDNAGYRSVLSGRPELLVDPDDTATMADKLAAYMKDDALRREVQAWGEKFTVQFDVGTVGRRLLAVYGEALRKRRNP